MKLPSLVAAAALCASHANAQESFLQEDTVAALLQNFDYASAEKIMCDPNAEKTSCIIEAWKKAATSNKTVVAFHMAPQRQTMSVVFPDGIVVELEPNQSGQPAHYPGPTV